MSRTAASLVLALWCLNAPRATLAQETINYGSISGRAIDSSGAAVAGARVTARQTETNATGSAATDREGRFRFPYLPIGPYELRIAASGFTDATRTLTLAAGAAFDLPVTLAVARVDAAVTVTAESAVLETARSQIAGTVSRGEIAAVPMNGRNIFDLALLVAGVSPPNVGGGTQLFAETSSIPGAGVSVGSQRNFSNNFLIDGLSANDDAAGLAGMAFGADAVDGVQVVTSGGQAELGRALGGYISVVTRSGTNALRGDLFDFERDTRLNAPNALSGTKLPMNQAQFGGSLGGPLRRNRSFFFANVEHRHLNQSGLVTIGDGAVSAINARLAAVGYPGPAVSTGIFANPVRTTTALAKLDHQPGDQDHLSVRYNAYDVFSANSRGAGALNAPSASAGLDSFDQSLAVSNVAALTATTVVEMRAQAAVSNLKAPPTDPVGPAVTITGVATFGTLSGSPTARRNRMAQLVTNLSYQTGAHALRLGVDALYNADTITFPRSVRGSYTFAALDNFLAGTYTTTGFSQTFGASVVSQTNPNLGVYAQDEWHAGPALTVNAGLRYDLQWLETIRTDRNNVSPRLGVAWRPFGSLHTVVRASAGIFYDRVPLRAVANALLSAGNTTDPASLQQTSVTLAPSQTGAPVFPNVLPGVVPLVTLPSFTTIDRHLQTASAWQMSVELEQQLGPRTTVAAGYTHLRGLHLIAQVNQNVPTCAASGANNGCRPVSTYANNNQYSSVGHSVYDALHVSWVQRASTWSSYRVSYTLSRSGNDVGEAFFNSPIDPTDISKDWGRSDDDQRHRLVVDGTLMGRGFQISALLQYYSALPFNLTTGANTVQGTAARPTVNGVFIPRNAGVGSDFFSLGLRVSRTFAAGPRVRIEALAEAFNLTGRRNPITRVTQFGTGAYPANPAANFGQVTAVGDPRQIQLGVRIRF